MAKMPASPTFIDLTGKSFGKWKVLSYAGKQPNGHAVWLCRCSCGNTRKVSSGNLRNKISTQCSSCGGRGPGGFHDLTGQTFGKWTVLGLHERKKVSGGTVIIWKCRCECGATSNVRANNLRSKGSRSCSKCARQGASNSNYRHGHSGDRHSLTYRSWASMVQRCTNPNDTVWDFYGGKGVKVCSEWLAFPNFLRDMGERTDYGLGIGRTNSNKSTKHYSCGHCKQCRRYGWKKHCRWMTTHERLRNKSNNHLLTHNGKTMSVTEWSEQPEVQALGIKKNTLFSRVITHKWDAERALTTRSRRAKHEEAN